MAFGLVLALLLAVWLAFTPTGHAALLVTDLTSGSNSSLLRILTRPAAAETITIPSPAGPVEAQLYQPAGDGPHGALVLALGYPSNINDPQLARVADDLARLGLVVLVPRLPGLRVGQLTYRDVEALVAAFEWLAGRPEVDPEHIGFAGFCVGSSLALAAAEDPRINQQVALVNVFGGYYDLLGLLRATAAHSAYYDGQEYPWQPHRQTVELFAQNLLLFVDDPADRTMLTQHFQDGAEGDRPPETTSVFAPIAYGLLTTTEPGAVDALMAQIPAEQLARAAALSPSAGIERLKAQVFIMHDASDPFVPVTESYRLAEAINGEVYAQFALFDHVRPDRSSSPLALIWEGVRLTRFLGRLLAEITPDDGRSGVTA